MIAWLLIVTEVALAAAKRPSPRYASGPSLSPDVLSAYLYHGVKPSSVFAAAAFPHLESAITQAVSLQTLSDIGLAAAPENALDFGRQSLCVPAVRFVQIWAEGEDTVFLRDVASSDSQFKLLREDLKPSTVHPGESLNFKLILFPQRLGTLSAYITVETQFGRAAYLLSAYIVENQFRVQPISLNAPKSVFFTNTDTAPVVIWDVFSMSDFIVVLSDQKFPYTIPANQTEHLFAVSYISSTAPGMVVVRTNHSNFYIPVATHHLRIFPSALRFGVVNSPALRHSIALLLSNFDSTAVRVLKVRSETVTVTTSIQKADIPPNTVNMTLGEVRFHPRMEGYYEGSIEIFTNATELPIVVPYRGYAVYGLVKFNETDFAFHPSDSHSRPVSLCVSHLKRLELLSASPARPLLSLRGFKPGLLLSPRPRTAFSLVPKVPYEYLGLRFVTLETQAGPVAIPTVVEDGNLWCVFADTFDICLFHNVIDIGSRNCGEEVTIELLVANRGLLAQHLEARTTETAHPLAVTVSDHRTEESAVLMDDSLSGDSYPLPPRTRLSVSVRVRIQSSASHASFSLHSVYQIYEFTIRWQFLSRVSPLSLSVSFSSFYFGQRKSVAILHCHDRDLVVSGWSGDTDALGFNPVSVPLSAGKTATIGDLVFPWKSDCNHTCEFSRDPFFADSNKRTVLPFDPATVPRKSKVTITLNSTERVEIRINADPDTFKFAANKIDFGLVTVSHPSRRFLKLTNPTEFPVCLQVFLFPEFSGMSEASLTKSHLQDTMQSAIVHFLRAQQSVPSFRIPSDSQLPYVLSPGQSTIIGPIGFSPTTLGAQHMTMLVKSNLTSVEMVRLTGQLTDGFLYVPMKLEHGGGKDCQTHRSTLTVTNIGNAPVVVTDVALGSGQCSYHDAAVEPCHSAYFLPPADSFQLDLFLKPSFIDPTVELKVRTEEEEWQYSVEVHWLEDRVHCDQGGWSTLFVLEITAIGVIAAVVGEWKGKQVCRLHITRSVTRSAPLGLQLFSPSDKSDKRKVKKHKKKKIPPIKLPDSSLQSDAQAAKTCEKEAPTVVFHDPSASNKSTIVGESMLEAKISDSEEDYLDEYKQSGLFSGFSLSFE